jgi:hypothetical protein
MHAKMPIDDGPFPEGRRVMFELRFGNGTNVAFLLTLRTALQCLMQAKLTNVKENVTFNPFVLAYTVAKSK